MADPFSVVTGCVGLITAAGATTKAITSFIRDCRAARGDLTSVARELADLQLILELLKEDGQGDALPGPLQAQINRIVKRCNSIVNKINSVLRRCKAPSGAIAWAASEKKEVDALRRELVAYREALSLNVETTTMLIAKSIKVDTEAIRDQTQFIPVIKDTTDKILEEIQCLRVSRPIEDGNVNPEDTILEDYYDGLAVYAESVCGNEVQGPGSAGKEKGNRWVNESSAAEPTSHSHEDEAARVEEKESSSEFLPLESKCQNCDSPIDEQARTVRHCGHWLCSKCIRSMLEASTQPPYPFPRCCSRMISCRQIGFLVDDKLKDKVNKIWARTLATCPRETCGGNVRYYVLRSSLLRYRIICGHCRQSICTWCYKNWHKESEETCAPNSELLPVFKLTTGHIS